MPWKTVDADKFRKGLTDKQKEKWATIANNTLRECIKKGGDELDCEVKAVKVANASFSDGQKDVTALSENPLSNRHTEEKIHLALSSPEDDGEYQLTLPIGYFHTGKYGDLVLTQTFAERMVENWKRLSSKNRGVFMDTDHDFGEANAWAEDMVVDDDGLKIKWNFNERGRELIKDKRYKFYSAAFGMAFDIETGEELFPALYTVSLTNSPVMYTMPEAHLSNKQTLSAHSDGEKNKQRRKHMEFAEILEGLKTLSDVEKGVIVKELGFSDLAEENERLSDQVKKLEGEKEVLTKTNKDLSEKVAATENEAKAKRKTEVIEKALSAGKILPKDKAYWEGKFDENPDFVADVLENQAPVIDLSNRGSGSGGGETAVQLSDEEKKLRLTEDDVREIETKGGNV